MKALQGFPYQTTNKTKIQSICEDHPVVFTREQVRLSSEIPCLNTQVLFSFGGETRFESFPFLIDNFFIKLCCFYHRFEENELVHSDLGTLSRIVAK